MKSDLQIERDEKALAMLNWIYASMAAHRYTWCQGSMGVGGIHCIMGWARRYDGVFGAELLAEYLGPLCPNIADEGLTIIVRQNLLAHRVIKMNDARSTTKDTMLLLLSQAITNIRLGK